MQIPEKVALYDRLGGVYNIATVVDDFIDRIMVEATGGPQHYSGRSMGDSHRHLMITAQEWQAFLDDFQQTLGKFNVPQPEQEELFAIVESTREAIVISPLKENPEQAHDAD